jgi:hypothetical protein
MPDELARRLEGIAATQHMSIQQFALARLSQNGGVFLTQRAACLIATHFLY